MYIYILFGFYLYFISFKIFSCSINIFNYLSCSNNWFLLIHNLKFKKLKKIIYIFFYVINSSINSVFFFLYHTKLSIMNNICILSLSSVLMFSILFYQTIYYSLSVQINQRKNILHNYYTLLILTSRRLL